MELYIYIYIYIERERERERERPVEAKMYVDQYIKTIYTYIYISVCVLCFHLDLRSGMKPQWYTSVDKWIIVDK